MCFRTLSFMGTWVSNECALLTLMVACMLFWWKWGISNAWSFGITLNIMRLYVVSIDGHVLSCFWRPLLLHSLWTTHWSCSYLLSYTSEYFFSLYILLLMHSFVVSKIWLCAPFLTLQVLLPRKEGLAYFSGKAAP
jgi:hypothetical protein